MRYGRHLGCIMFDLDHFKRVNDLHGHLAGDAVLHAVGTCVKGMLRSSDIAGRYGGEEFVVAVPEMNRDSAASIAEKLRKAIESLVIAIPGNQTLRITASFGFAALHAAAPTDNRKSGAAVLVNRADEVLYRANKAGRNRWSNLIRVAHTDTARRCHRTKNQRD